MIMYSKKVDLRSRKEMIDFLTGHFRYDTMNSWNQSTSYAHNVKIHNLGFTREQEQKLYEMIETDEFYEYIRDILNDFSVRHRYLWQVGFNGRNSGYLVLYQGYAKPSGYKSVCTECGQRNYKSVSETGNCKCGRCGANARIDYVTPPLEVGCYPGRNKCINCGNVLSWFVTLTSSATISSPWLPASLRIMRFARRQCTVLRS